mgnify:CR=1 FL=1
MNEAVFKISVKETVDFLKSISLFKDYRLLKDIGLYKEETIEVSKTNDYLKIYDVIVNNNDYIKITVKNNSFVVISEISVYQDNKLMLTDDSGDNVVLFNNDVLGNSEITVVVKYDQGDGIINVVSVTEICFKDPTLESMVLLPHLPLNSTLSDVIVRLNEVDLLTGIIRNNMRDLLLANDIDVPEGARLSDMVRLTKGEFSRLNAIITPF